MTLTTVIPKVGDKSDFIGKSIYNVVKEEIGTITEVKEVGDTYELSLRVVGLYSKPDSDEYAAQLLRGFRLPD